MRPRFLVCLGLACSMWLAVPAASANPPGPRYGSPAEARHEAHRNSGQFRPSHHGQGPSRQARERERERDHWRGGDRRGPPPHAQPRWRDHPGRGWAPPPHYGWQPPRHHPRWSRGDRLPHDYRHSRYVVRDWRDRRYSHPPRGYQWMQVDGQVLLVGIATGLILQSLVRD